MVESSLPKADLVLVLSEAVLVLVLDQSNGSRRRTRTKDEDDFQVPMRTPRRFWPSLLKP